MYFTLLEKKKDILTIINKRKKSMINKEFYELYSSIILLIMYIFLYISWL